MILLPPHYERDLVGGNGYRGFAGSSADPRQWVASIGLLAEQRNERLTQPYAQSEWIYSAVRAVAKTLAAIPLSVYRGSAKKPTRVEAGPLVALLEDPSPEAGTEEWLTSVISWIELRGEAFIVPAGADGQPLPPGARTMPASLLVVAPTRLRAKTDPTTDRLIEWVADQDRLKLLPEQVIHVKLWNPYDAHRGMDPMSLAVLIGEPIYQGNLFNAALLRNNCFLGGTLKVQGRADEAVRRRLREGWIEAHGGPNNAGMPAVLDQGTEYIPNDTTHKDMQFMDLMRWGRDAIVGGIYGVPKGILSITDDLNYATQLGEERAFYTRTCLPLGRLITSQLSRWFRSRLGVQEWVAFDASDIAALQENLVERMTVAEKLKALGYTAEEINERLDLGMPGGKSWRAKAWGTGTEVPFDVLESGFEEFDQEPGAEPAATPAGASTPASGAEAVQDTALNGAQVTSLVDIIAQVVAGTLPAESAVQIILVAFPQVSAAQAAAMVNPAEAMEPPEPAPAQPAQAPPPPEGAENGAGKGTEPERARSFPAGVRAERRAIVETWNRAIRVPSETRIYRAALRLLARMRRKTLANFRSVVRGKRSPMPPLSAVEIEAILFAQAEWDRAVEALMSDPFWQTIAASGEGVAQELGTSFVMDKNDPRWLKLHGRRIAALVDAGKATRVALREAIIKALATQETVADVEAAIASSGEFTPGRAMRIGRTESGALASGTRFDEMASNGVSKHEWVTAADDHVRESHQNVDGEIVPVGERFSNGLMHPHDQGADDPGEVVNCRCSAVAVIDLDAE